MNEWEILQKIKDTYKSILKDKLVGIYVHGSLAFQCFHWEKSDIDFLVVVNQKLSQKEKEALISALLLLDKFVPKKGLEMSVILESVCNPFIYPTPFELHFSNMHKKKFQENLSDYCEKMNGIDKDLAAHITVTHKVGILLCGKKIKEVFVAVPKECYLDSILTDIENADKEIEENPVYYILNLCRVLAYLENDVILSKQQGGEWGIQNLPAVYSTLMKKALKSYNTNMDFAKDNLVYDFAKGMLKYINQSVGVF